MTLSQQLAGFTWDKTAKLYLVEVCGYIVARFRTIAEVEAFSAMHHDGFNRSATK